MIRYFELSADQGNANAQFNLGFQYSIGEGVDQDYDKAFQLFQMSANQGFPAAMFAYGDCYYLGSGVEQNLETAAQWYQKALDAGYEPDEEDRKHLEDVLGKQLN
jgi:TPR repeat protein